MPPPLLLPAVCLLLSQGWFACASNPDSEIFEDPKPGDQKSKASEQLQNVQEAQPIDQGMPSLPLDQAIGPIRTGTFVTKEVLRQVLPNGVETVSGRQSFVESPLPPPSFGGTSIGRSVPVFGVSRASYGVRRYNRVSYGQATYQQTNSSETVPVRMLVSSNRYSGHQRIPFEPNRNAGWVPSTSTGNSERFPQRIPNGNNRQPFPGSREAPSTANAGGGNNYRRLVVRRPVYRPFLSTGTRDSNRAAASNVGGHPRPQNPSLPARPVGTGGGADTSPPRPTSNGGGSADMNLYSGIINDFAFGLVDSLDLKTNFVFSPPSIFVALAMCYLGSEGSTKAQLENFLGLNMYSVHGDRLHQGVRDLMRTVLYQSSSDHRLFVANGMFLDRKYQVNPDFRSRLRSFYAAEMSNLDFSDQEGSVAAINRWLSRATRNMITDVGNEPPSPMTSLLLLNAVYFRGTWKKQFPPNMTYPGRFFTADGKDKMVPTMPLYGETFPLHRSDALRHTFLKLPYQGDQISMILALPHTRADRPMPSNSDRQLCEVRDALRDTPLDTVALPKFRTEFSASLRTPLTRMGVTDLFDAAKVDLRGMRSANDVVVSEVVSKAVLEVSERGTEASATTGVRFVPLAYRNTTDFVANHPFAYYVVHEPSGLVLFYGKVFDLGVDPASNNPGV